MKILFAIQGSGNGRLNRARDLIPLLERYGKLDLYLSGPPSEIALPHKVHYSSDGFSYQYTPRGGIDFWKTFRHNRLARILADISTCPVERYDLVINDFEPITAWACKQKGVPCFSIGHQAALTSPLSPRPKGRHPLGEWLIHHYAPATPGVGFHFEAYDDWIFTPIIRQQIRRLTPTYEGHITVYLPVSNDHLLLNVFSRFKSFRWEVFSKHCKSPFERDNVRFRPVNNFSFSQSLARSSGALTMAGFETPAEALFLGKKLLVIPVKSQYDQWCNAEALSRMGVTVADRFGPEMTSTLLNWLEKPNPTPLYFPNIGEAAVERIMATALGNTSPTPKAGPQRERTEGPGSNEEKIRILKRSPSGAN